jgi:hypothetical protein
VTVECFRRRRFREASLRLITALRDIASDYAADGMSSPAGTALGWLHVPYLIRLRDAQSLARKDPQ